METTIITSKKISPKKPILLVGLPGIGNVGTIVAQHIIKEFKAERFATLYSPYLPYKVMMEKDGGLSLVNNRFYYIKARKGMKNDVIILTGDDQPLTTEGQYEVNSKILDFFVDKLKGTFVYTIGGYRGAGAQGAPNTKTPRVFANATDKKTISAFKSQKIIFGESTGIIWGSAGMIIAFAQIREIPGICLMGESGSIDIDPAAAKSVLEVLSKKLGLPINMKDIDSMIADVAKALKKIEEEVNNNMQATGGYPSSEKSSYIR